MVMPLMFLIVAFVLGILAVIVDPEPVMTRMKRIPADFLWALVAAFVFEAFVIATMGH